MFQEGGGRLGEKKKKKVLLDSFGFTTVLTSYLPRETYFYLQESFQARSSI